MEDIDPKTSIGDIMQYKVLKYELLIIGLVILVLCLAFLKVPYIGTISTLVLLSVACIYFLSAFAIIEGPDITAIDNFIHKLIALGSSFAVIGILFLSRKWPNAQTFSAVGILTLCMCLVALVYQRIKAPEVEKFSNLVLLRTIILLLITGGLLYLELK